MVCVCVWGGGGGGVAEGLGSPKRVECAGVGADGWQQQVQQVQQAGRCSGRVAGAHTRAFEDVDAFLFDSS